MWQLSFLVWLISLYIVISSSIYFPKNVTSFFFMARIYSTVCINSSFSLSVHLLMGTYTDSVFWLLWVIVL
jgi:hypothetical protein